MQFRYLLAGIVVVVVTTPASAQSSPIGEAVRGTLTPTPLTTPPVQLPDPVPPPSPPRSAAPPPPPAPTLARGVRPRAQARWASYFQYPKGLDFLDEEGWTSLRASVSVLGRVTDCSVTRSSGFDRLDQAACAAMTRYARFDPALDSAGNPTTGQFSTRVRWVPAFDRNFSNRHLEWSYPKEARQQKAKGMVSIQFKVAPDGRVFDCRVTASSGFPILDETTCARTEKMRGSRAVEPSEFMSKPRLVRRVVEWK